MLLICPEVYNSHYHADDVSYTDNGTYVNQSIFQTVTHYILIFPLSRIVLYCCNKYCNISIYCNIVASLHPLKYYIIEWPNILFTILSIHSIITLHYTIVYSYLPEKGQRVHMSHRFSMGKVFWRVIKWNHVSIDSLCQA